MPSLSNSPRMRSAPPQWILMGHLANQTDGLGGYPRLSLNGLGFESPKQSKAVSMPAKQCRRLNDEQDLTPSPCDFGEQKQAQAIIGFQGGALYRSFQQNKLVPEQRVLGNEIRLTSRKVQHCAGQCMFLRRSTNCLHNAVDALRDPRDKPTGR